MKGAWRIRLVAVIVGVGIMASTAFAARTPGGADTPDGTCASCLGVMTNTPTDRYPDAQPLETCNDEVCIFW